MRERDSDMITLEHERLVFRFPKVHDEAECAISFQRTLRIPDDGKSYPLPPGAFVTFAVGSVAQIRGWFGCSRNKWT